MMIFRCKQKFGFSFLKDVTVLDLSRIIVGPYASMVLADFGARVIKVEHPAGDETRRWGPPYKGDFSCYFLSINRNKESMTLNLKNPQSHKILHKLVQKSDVVLQNFIPGTTERLKVDYKTLSQINPKLVYCSISGYGDVGPKKHEPAYDQILQGYSGYMHLSGDPEGSPYKLGFAIIDVLTGLNASNAILAALNNRVNTGKGAHIKSSLLQSSIAALINQSSNYLNGGLSPTRIGNKHPNICPYGAFQCKDKEYITITVGNQEHYQSLIKVLRIQNHQYLDSNEKRVIRRPEVDEIISTKTRLISARQLREKLSAVGVPNGPINDLPSLFDDSQVKSLGMVKQIKDGDEVYKYLRSPIRTDDQGVMEPTMAPRLGEHTEAILQSLGYTKSDIMQFKAKGVI